MQEDPQGEAQSADQEGKDESAGVVGVGVAQQEGVDASAQTRAVHVLRHLKKEWLASSRDLRGAEGNECIYAHKVM